MRGLHEQTARTMTRRALLDQLEEALGFLDRRLCDLGRTCVHSGEVRPLGITGASRDADLPDIPTLAESGYPAVTSTSGTGIVAPAGIPREIVARLNSKLNELIERPETQARMKSFGLVPRSGPPEEFGAWAAQERQRWTRVVKQSGAKAD